MKRYRWFALIFVVLLFASPCPAQEKTDIPTSIPKMVQKAFGKDESTEQSKETKNTTVSFPGLADVVPRAADLGQKAIKAEETIVTTADLSSFGRQIAEVENRVGQLARRLAGMGDPAGWNIYRLLDAQHLIQSENTKIGALLDAISTKLSEIEGIGKRWEEERLFWKKWEESLREAHSEIPLENFKKVEETSTAVIRAASSASAPLLAIQQKLTKLLEDIRQQSLPVDTALKKVRSETFVKNSPSFFSREFYALFDKTLWVSLKGGLAEGWKLEREYLPNYGWLLFLQVLATLTIISVLRRRRQFSEKTAEWYFIRQHPWAFSIFAVQALALLLYSGPAPSWVLLNLILVIFSSLFLISGMLPHPRVRRAFFLLAGVLTISSALKLISLPAPLYSLFLALICVLGIGFFAREAKRCQEEQGGQLHWISVCLRGAPLIFFAALLLLLAGYSNLALYLVRSSLATLFFIILAILFLHMGNGCIEMLLRQPAVTRLGLVKRFGEALEIRLKKLLKALLLFFLLMALFQLWGIYTSFSQAWERIFDFQFVVGEVTLSLGRILTAAFLLYIVVSGSWFIRAFLEGEVFPRQQLDRGASDAIKKLIHYSLLFVGIMMAISLIGLNLTSFAFLTGAVGIGVGFGLQNIVNNFVSGLMLLFERPFKVGDVVVVDNETGTVRKIGLRSTLIETFDRSELIVPNSQFISGKVTNWTRSNHIARIKIAVGVAYGSDVELVLSLLKEAGQTDPRVLVNPEPNPLFLRFGESALEFELHTWIADVKDLLSVRSHLCQEIASRFRLAGIEIPYPQRDLHLRSIDKTLLERGLGPRKNGLPD